MGVEVARTIVSAPEDSGAGDPGEGGATSRGAVVERIRAFLLERFPEARARPPAADDPLLDGGLLHSLGILEVVEFLESEYGIVFADAEVTAEVFSTLESLGAFVVRKRGGGEARAR